MSIERNQERPLFTGPPPPHPISGKEKTSSKKANQRINVLEHFGADKTVAISDEDPSFFVRAMEVPTGKSGLLARLKCRLLYVEVNIDSVTGKGKGTNTTTVALNVNSLAKRMGITPKEIRILDKRGELENALTKKAELINSRGSFVSGLSPRTFLNVLQIAQDHMKNMTKNPELSPVVQAEGREFIVRTLPSKESERSTLKYHLFSTDLELLGEGAQGAAYRIKEVAGNHAVFKTTRLDLEGVERERSDVAIEYEARKLTEINSGGSNKSHFQAAPLFKAKLIEINVGGQLIKGSVNPLYSGGDFTKTIKEDLTKTQKDELAGHILDGLIELDNEDLVHLDIKPENILVDKHGHPKIADWGGTATVTFTAGYITLDEGLRLMKLRDPNGADNTRYKEMGKAGDVYATGVMLYKLYNKGKEPYDLDPYEVHQEDDRYRHNPTYPFIPYNPRTSNYPRDKLQSFPRTPSDPDAHRQALEFNLTKNGCPPAAAKLIVKMLELDPSVRIARSEIATERQNLSKNNNQL